MNKKGLKVSNRITFNKGKEKNSNGKDINEIFNQFLDDNDVLKKFFKITVDNSENGVLVNIDVLKWSYECVSVLEALFLISLYLKINYNFSFKVSCLKDKNCVILQEVITNIQSKLKEVENLEELKEIVLNEFEKLYNEFQVSYSLNVSKWC